MVDTQEMKLLGRISNGDEEAFAELYRAHAPVVYKYCLRMLHSPDEAGEVVSSLFLALWTESRRGGGEATDVRTRLISRARSEILGRTGPRRSGDPDRAIDLRTLAARYHGKETVPPPGPHPDGAGVAAAIGDLDYYRLKIVSLAYFNGMSIPEIARRMDLTPRECLMRLNEALTSLASPGRNSPAHEVAFAGYPGAYALGVLDDASRREFEAHLDGGCPPCTAEIRRLSAASHRLTLLLQDADPPPDLLEKILFSLRLAQLIGSGGPPPAEYPAAPVEPGPAVTKRRFRVAPAVWIPALMLALGTACVLHILTLQRVIDEQRDLIAMQEMKAAELLVKYDRLAGMSGFVESDGPVAVLTGQPGYNGVSGKILLDTAGRNAMLQIINLPWECAGKEVEVSAVGESARLKVAGFRLSERDSGRVIYRFFPVEGRKIAAAGKFSVSVSEPGEMSSSGRRTILEGENTGRP